MNPNDGTIDFHKVWYETLPHKLALIDALKSGKYKKGAGCLRAQDDTWCCYGVASDISDLGEFVSVTDQRSYWAFVDAAADTNALVLSAALFSDEVNLWLTGVPEPDRVPGNSQGKLYTRDGEPVTFVYKSIPYWFLYSLNDNVDTFDPIIAALERHVANPYRDTIIITGC